MTLTRLNHLWDQYQTRLAEPLPKPVLRIRLRFPDPRQLGLCQAGVVYLSPLAGDWWAYHEFAHYLWWRRDIEHTPLGARFLEAARMGLWDTAARELFADCVAWLITGKWRRGWPRSVNAARMLLPLFR